MVMKENDVPDEVKTCGKCGAEVVERGWFWVLTSEAESKMVTTCPAGGVHDPDDKDE